MKTSEQFSFSKLENEFLENVIKQLFNQHYLISQMFFNVPKDLDYAHLIIVMEHKKDVEVLKQQKWVVKAFIEYQVKVCFYYSTQMHHKFSLGHPFIELYCKPSAIIYQNEQYENHLMVKRDWKKFNKKFNKYKDSFFHDHDLLLAQANSFISQDSSIGVVLAFEKLFEHDLKYLENLHLGNDYNEKDLNKRIKDLSLYIPKIQKFFVKHKSNTYYLLHLSEEVKMDSIEFDPLCIDEMYQAFIIAEESLFGLVEERFDEFRNLIKVKISEEQKSDNTHIIDQRDEILDMATETIVSAKELEEIYLYNRSIYGETSIYYLLLIGFNISNEFLKDIRHKIRNKVSEKYDFVLIAHDRQWIQKNLSIHQNFFVNIIQGKNKIYESHPYYPEPHWENPHNSSYLGTLNLPIFYQSTNNSAKQIFLIAENTEVNYQGLPYLYSLFFLSFCRTYIFAKLFYEPHYLPSHFLWKLCLYANPELRKLEHLFDEFSLKFFSFLDYNRTLHHRSDYFKKEDVDKMKTIVEVLLNELNKIVDQKNRSFSNETVE